MGTMAAPGNPSSRRFVARVRPPKSLPGTRPRGPCACGFTIIELVVTLGVLGLVFGLVAPALITGPAERDDAVRHVIDAARRSAVRRAEALTLTFQAGGRWTLEGGRDPAPLRLRDGSVDWPYSTARLHISPLGACILDATAATEQSLSLDPVRCRLRRGGSGGSSAP